MVFMHLMPSANKYCNKSSINTVSAHREHAFFDTWYARLRHASSKIIESILKHFKIPFNLNKMTLLCKACCIGISQKLPFNDSLTHYDTPLQLIYSDVWGPSPIPSTNGCKFYIIYMDACTKFIWIYLLHTKSQAFSTFVHFKTMVENQFSLKIKAFQSDGGREYSPFTCYLTSYGIQHRLSCPYTSEKKKWIS